MKNFEQQFGPARVVFRDAVLEINTGVCRRVWKLDNGLSTVFFGKGEKNLLDARADHRDWQVNVCKGPAEFQDFQCRLHPADDRSSEYVETFLTFFYPEVRIFVRCEIDCFPGISGFRTQLAFKSAYPIPETGDFPEKYLIPGFLQGYSESLPVAPEKFRRLAFGYACDSQHRYNFETPILTEIRNDAKKVRTTEAYEASNGLVLTDASGCSITLIKESHKCTNCTGLDTGAFVIHAHEVRVTGFGFSQGGVYWLNDQDFHTAWAAWSLYSENEEKGMRGTLKQFDSLRYPFREERDMLIAANLWGSRGAGELSRSAAEEQNLLKELDSCADLGIDLLQVDDGWQFDPGTSDFFHCEWRPSKIRFPHGWTLLKETAAKLGVKLGIWFPEFADTEKILQNVREAGFKRIKLDFVHLTSRSDLDKLLQKAELIAKNFPDAGVNWDITESSPRMGFFFGRESGNIFLQNNENSKPGACNMSFIGYDPEITLRQIWMLGKYLNLNQVQVTIQRVADSPNGKNYPQDYAFAIAMAGIPLFFTETCRFKDQERSQLRSLIAVYKKYRSQMLKSFVTPVGEEPFGCSWSGFQWKTSEKEGFLLIFREKNAEENTGYFKLDDFGLKLEPLYHGEHTVLTVIGDRFGFQGIEKGAFAFYKYSELPVPT